MGLHEKSGTNQGRKPRTPENDLSVLVDKTARQFLPASSAEYLVKAAR